MACKLLIRRSSVVDSVLLHWETAHAVPDQPQFVLEWARQWQAAEKFVYSRTLAEPRSARTRIERSKTPSEMSATLLCNATVDFPSSILGRVVEQHGPHDVRHDREAERGRNGPLRPVSLLRARGRAGVERDLLANFCAGGGGAPSRAPATAPLFPLKGKEPTTSFTSAAPAVAADTSEAPTRIDDLLYQSDSEGAQA
jgi:hypothetical protein